MKSAAAVGGCCAAGRVGDDTLSMSGEVVGQAVNAVLAPPQAERFARVVGVDLGRPGCASAWADLLASAARVDHPFWDLDPGEWGTGLWRRRRRDFSALWARGWRAYARARGLDVGSGPLETAFRLRHALGLLADPGDPAVVGTIEEHLAQL